MAWGLRGGGCAEVTGPGLAGPLEAKLLDRDFVLFGWEGSQDF